MDHLLKSPFTVNTTTGVTGISGLILKENLEAPASATHVRVTGGWTGIDFGTGLAELVVSNQVVLPLNSTTNNVQLTPTVLPGGTGTDIFVLQVIFYQEINGVQYALKNGEGNAMGIVGIV